MKADRILNVVVEYAKLEKKQIDIKEKKYQLDGVTSLQCGNCKFWMTSGCEREKKFREFKSMNSSACEKFQISAGSALLRDKFLIELRRLQAS